MTGHKVAVKILNKAKIPIIPPLLENGLFVTDFTEKAKIFNDYFILQCSTIETGSELPDYVPIPIARIDDFEISDEKILNIIGKPYMEVARQCANINCMRKRAAHARMHARSHMHMSRTHFPHEFEQR